MYKGFRSCPTETYYTLTTGKINLSQFYLSLCPIATLLEVEMEHCMAISSVHLILTLHVAYQDTATLLLMHLSF